MCILRLKPVVQFEVLARVHAIGIYDNTVRHFCLQNILFSTALNAQSAMFKCLKVDL